MNVNLAIKNRIAQLFQEEIKDSSVLLQDFEGEIMLGTVEDICSKFHISVADFFNSDLFRNLERN